MKWTAFLLLAALAASGQVFTTGQAGRFLIGQSNFTAGYPGTDQSILSSPTGLAIVNDTLLVVDANRVGASPSNNRVLLYRNLSGFVPGMREPYPQKNLRCPACIGQADLVVGQPALDKIETEPRTQSNKTLRDPVAVASNGRYTAVADTNNNRVLVWKGVPAETAVAADFVVGQADFSGVRPARTRAGLSGPQGVWFDSRDGLWVADASNSRVLYYGVITKNGQDAQIVLGQTDFGVNVQPPLAGEARVVRADTLVTPVSVTSDGTRLYVADLGASRIMIWNAIPTKNAQPADVVIGQLDMSKGDPNPVKDLCESNGTDSDGNATYPGRCAKTLEMPRYALSDGTRLFVSDSGNDRVLIYNTIPAGNAAAADTILGQQDDKLNMMSDSAEPRRVSASDAIRTPHGLAFDGTNLYVADVYNRRVLIFSPGDFTMPYAAVRNAASPEVYALGAVTFGGSAAKDDKLTIKIKDTEYSITLTGNETIIGLIDSFIKLINAGTGDPHVFASPNYVLDAIILTARDSGPLGNEVALEAKASDGAKMTLTASGANLSGGQDAARIAPYAMVKVLGENLSDETASADPTQPLPYELGGVEVFFDGLRAPLSSVSPSGIVAQMPADVFDAVNSNFFLRVRRKDGRITVGTAVAVPTIDSNPGVYAAEGVDPRPAFAYHFSSGATGTVSVDGTAQAKDVATVYIEGRPYSYTVQGGDTLADIRDGLIAVINAADPKVEAYAAGIFARIRLRARVPGPAGNGIAVATNVSEGAQVILTATNATLCCANEAGAPITPENPAVPGETFVVLASGLGVVKPDQARESMVTGVPYDGPYYNEPNEFVSSLAGGKTANVLFCGLRQGVVGTYEVHLELNADMPTNPYTQVTIAQSYQVSNIFTIPIVNPNAAAPSASLTTFTLGSSSVIGGQDVTGNFVTLDWPAPADGATITLSSSKTSVATVPDNVVVPAGATRSPVFTINTKAVTESTTVTITASYGIVSKTVTLTVNKQP